MERDWGGAKRELTYDGDEYCDNDEDEKGLPSRRTGSRKRRGTNDDPDQRQAGRQEGRKHLAGESERYDRENHCCKCSQILKERRGEMSERESIGAATNEAAKPGAKLSRKNRHKRRLFRFDPSTSACYLLTRLSLLPNDFGCLGIRSTLCQFSSFPDVEELPRCVSNNTSLKCKQGESFDDPKKQDPKEMPARLVMKRERFHYGPRSRIMRMLLTSIRVGTPFFPNLLLSRWGVDGSRKTNSAGRGIRRNK